MAAVVSVRMEATDGASKVIKNISKSLESLGIMPSLDVGDLGGSFVGFVKDVGATVWQLHGDGRKRWHFWYGDAGGNA